jgi:predicted Rossmann-fold nucleotide-binding protein
MGGHSLLRTYPDYKKAVMLSKKLVEKGYLMLSGGGPGAMDATHFGAWYAGRHENEVEDGLAILSKAPAYKDKEWFSAAYRVMAKYPRKNSQCTDIGIPTWLYGHEPTTPFACKYAKYFANSVREEGLLALAKGGIVYAPGSAGTIQEIFQDAAQNHYAVYGYPSPMIFLNRTYWTETKPVYPLLQRLAEGKPYGKLLSITDDVEDIITTIERFTAGT